MSLICIYHITQQLYSWEFIRENLGQHKNFIQMFITALFIFLLMNNSYTMKCTNLKFCNSLCLG